MLQQANTKRERLIARIILNHPRLYHERRLTWAGHILQEKSAEARHSRPYRMYTFLAVYWWA